VALAIKYTTSNPDFLFFFTKISENFVGSVNLHGFRDSIQYNYLCKQKGAADMSIDLWAARLERALTEQEIERMARILPPNRRERLMKLREDKRREPLCAYLLLCLALWELYEWRGLPEVAENPMGKPYFPEHPDVHFNISHTSGAVLVGISDQPVGVDIEKIRPVSQRAMRRLAGVSTESDFYQSWVRREARTKRSGNGIGTMMRSETPLQQGEFYYELDTFPGFVAGVATRDRSPLGPLRKYSLDELL